MNKKADSYLLFAGIYRIASWALAAAQLVYLLASRTGAVAEDAQVFWTLFIACVACVARADALRALSMLKNGAEDGRELDQRA